MKKLTFKGAMKTLQGAAMDGAIIYAGRTGYRIVNKQVGSLLPAAIPVQVHGAVVGAIGVLAADMLLPSKYSRLAGAAMASEVIEEFVSPYIEPMLVSSGLVYGLPAATAQGYGKMRGYGRVGLAGMASMRAVPTDARSFTGN